MVMLLIARVHFGFPLYGSRRIESLVASDGFQA